jgi:hypothetical protein
LDDILLASNSKDEHLTDLRTVFSRLEEHGLVLRLEKCVFWVDTLDFLGHMISRDGAIPLPKKVDVINGFPKPATVGQLQEFLGMINFYHRFLPNAAHALHPLYAAYEESQSQRHPTLVRRYENRFSTC